MNPENTQKQESNKKQWLTPELKIYGDVVKITAEMLGGGKSVSSSFSS